MILFRAFVYLIESVFGGKLIIQMNYFKNSEELSHKNLSNIPQTKEFITDREFVQDHSLNSSDLNLSFNSINNSFFSESSNKSNDNYKSPRILQQVTTKPCKEEETNYASKASPVILEKEEFDKPWLCQNCEVLKSCRLFCLIF